MTSERNFSARETRVIVKRRFNAEKDGLNLSRYMFTDNKKFARCVDQVKLGLQSMKAMIKIETKHKTIPAKVQHRASLPTSSSQYENFEKEQLHQVQGQSRKQFRRLMPKVVFTRGSQDDLLVLKMGIEEEESASARLLREIDEKIQDIEINMLYAVANDAGYKLDFERREWRRPDGRLLSISEYSDLYFRLLDHIVLADDTSRKQTALSAEFALNLRIWVCVYFDLEQPLSEYHRRQRSAIENLVLLLSWIKYIEKEQLTGYSRNEYERVMSHLWTLFLRGTIRKEKARWLLQDRFMCDGWLQNMRCFLFRQCTDIYNELSDKKLKRRVLPTKRGKLCEDIADLFDVYACRVHYGVVKLFPTNVLAKSLWFDWF
ncbi:uncharacterized protein LOC106173976 isoform X2 [Lingula anatina]|nr:uncharacterized protein LOC106173976 isoform X2 [Lingula anatina]XP_013410786.1 uncharacterized protein LOC106173976 isoform X2 [Lingula anatina]|eukprot:XP_013410785.1 uncharacterized protein LOC106173976 isoform X2 [Lingula anatina]